MGSRLKFATLGAVSALVATVHAATWHVAPAGDNAGTGSQADPLATVAAAVNAASNGDTILIGSGLYDAAGFTVDKAGLTFVGGYDTNTWTQSASPTILRHGGTVATLVQGASDTTFRRLTLTSSNPEWGWCDGIRLQAAAATTTIADCILTNCSRAVHNAGNYHPQDITVENTLIARNAYDGILYNNSNVGTLDIGTLVVRNCTIADNGANGIQSNTGNPDHYDAHCVIQNTLFAGNRRAGFYKKGCRPGATVENCLFDANGDGAINAHLVSPAMTACRYGAPRFADRAAGDYHLLADSAAGAAGADLSAYFTTDLDGAPRGVAGWDIGAYETAGAGAPAELPLAYVDAATGSDATGDGSASAPFATVAYALARTAANGEIRVAGGTYTADRLSFFGKGGITVKGAYVVGSPDWTYSPATTETILDGAGATVASLSCDATGCRLVSLTLRNATDGYAAGLRFAVHGHLVECDGCRFLGNYHGVYGAWNQKGGATLRNCIIAGSSSHAVHFEHIAQVAHSANPGPFTFLNCTVADNGGSGYWHGGNQDWADVPPVAKNTIFAFHGGYGITKRGGSSGASIQNCLFYANTAGDIYDYGQGKFEYLGGIKNGVDPLFTDAENRDYTLVAGSGAAAAGVDLSAATPGVTDDILGTARPDNGWDIGAYECPVSGEPARLAAVHVAPSGDDSTGDGSASAPFATVAKALSRVAPGGVVRIAGGDYAESFAVGNSMTELSIEGAYDPATWTRSPATHPTVFTSAAANKPVVQIAGGASSNSFSRLTFTGATSSSGVEFTGSAPYSFFESCIFTNNYYGVYSGVRMPQTAVYKNCLIAKNARQGIYYFFRQEANKGYITYNTLVNCTIADNGASGYESSGNDDWGVMAPQVINCIVAGNKGYGIRRSGGPKGGFVTNSLFYANSSGDWYDAAGRFTCTGGNKLARDPEFVDPENGDYHLKGTSPAAAAGLDVSAEYGVTDDLDGLSRPQGDDWDMGCFESDGLGDASVTLLDDAYVSIATGSDATGDGSQAKPYASIAKAFSFTTATSTIHVAAGTYEECISFPAERCGTTVAGGYDPVGWTRTANPLLTVIDGKGTSAATLATDANDNVLRNLTLKGATAYNAAGIAFNANSSGLLVDSCMIVSNYYGIYSADHLSIHFTMVNTVVAQNSSHGFYFGAMHSNPALGGVGNVVNCVIADNGGDGYSNYGNTDWYDVMPNVKNSIVAGNGGFGLLARGSRNPRPRVGNSLFFGNTRGPVYANSYSGQKFEDLGGNITGRDPLFADPHALDYGVRTGSPAIGAGLDLSADFGLTTDAFGAVRPSDAWTLGVKESSGDPAPALRTETFVATTGSDATGDGSAAAPYATLRHAIGQTAAGGVLKIAGGTYADNIEIGLDKHGMTLQGGYDPATWACNPAANPTTVTGANNGSPLAFFVGGCSNLVENLTLTGGTFVFANNLQLYSGGVGLFGEVEGNVIESCRITGNHYGVSSPHESKEDIEFRNCVIANNAGSGLSFDHNWVTYGRSKSGECRLFNCTVADNGAHGVLCNANGGAEDRDYTEPILVNTIVANNAGYGVYKANAGVGESPPNTDVCGSLACCLFYGNTAGDAYIPHDARYTRDGPFLDDLGGNLWGDASVDPMFNAADTANPYSLAEFSPAINAGTNSVAEAGLFRDILGRRRPSMRRYDIGAYEFQCPQGTILFIR
ncbi:MAG: right-handed parallel beta-helix repeat-containing protein [Kiritimatiellia bacterium]